MSNGSIDYAMPDFQDPFKGFREELGNIETKRKQSQEKAFEMAEMIEAADSATMFGNDYSIATKWAQNLTDNLSAMSSSTDGMIQFAQQANMLKSFIDGSEAYRTENIGSVKDGPQAGHWQGAVQRSISGVNPYGDQRDGKSMSDHEAQYKDLNESLEVAFDESGSPIIRKGGREMSLSQYQRPENPFMPSLVDDFFSESGFNWYDGRQEALKHAHTSADAAKEMALNSLDERMIRGIVNTHLKGLKDSEMSFEEAIKNEDVRKKAINNWLGGVANAWEGKNVVDAVDAEDMIFSGGLTSPEGFKTEVPGSGLIKEGDYIANSQGTSDLLNNLGSAIESPLETVGFNSLRMLNEPVNHDFTAELGEEQQIVAVNVDRNGNIHATLQTLTDDPNGELGFEGNKIKTNSVVVYEVDSPLHGTLKNKLTPEVYKNMLAKSESVSSNQRRLRIKRAFDNAIPYEGVTYGAPGSESAGSPTEATSTPTEATPATQRNTEGSANNQNSPFLSAEEVRQQKVMSVIDPTGSERFSNPELSTLVEDAIAAGYDEDDIVSVLQSDEWRENRPTIYRETLINQVKGFGRDIGSLLTGRGSSVVGKNARRAKEAETNRNNLFEAFKNTANPAQPDTEVEDAEPAGIDPGAVEPVALEEVGIDPGVAENLREEAPETAKAVETTITQAGNDGIDISEAGEATEKQHLEEVASIVESQLSLLSFAGVNEAQLGDSLTQVYRGLLGNSSDETWDAINKSWCALFTANVLTVGGVAVGDLPEGGDKFVAKKYKKIGDPVYDKGRTEFNSSKLKYGDLVIMDSSNPKAASWKGHIAFYVGMNPDGKIRLLGGNQNHSINITPYDTSLIEDIRRVSFDTTEMEKVTKELGLGQANASMD